MRNLVKGVFVVMALALAGEARGDEKRWFADLYIGIAAMKGTTIAATGQPPIKVDSQQSFIGGGRIGYWLSMKGHSIFEDRIGLGLDVSAFNPANEIHTVVTTSPLIMLRNPGSTFEPYLGIGPAFPVAKIDVRSGVLSETVRGRGAGVLIPLGILIKSANGWEIFTEYRFSRGFLEQDSRGAVRTFIDALGQEVPETGKVRATITTHAVVVGIRF